jgi:hypothetical protein
MLWTSFGAGGYSVGVAKSTSGDILGPWEQVPEPLYAGDGGHCMIFRSFDGQLWLTFHRPNQSPDERPQFFPLVERGSSIHLADSMA